MLRCALAALLRGDPMAGTAAPAGGFLLVEQPGGWGRQALTCSRLDAEVGPGRVGPGDRAGAAGAAGPAAGPAAGTGAPGLVPVDARPGHEAAWWGDFDRDGELLDLPLDGSAGTVSDDPF